MNVQEQISTITKILDDVDSRHIMTTSNAALARFIAQQICDHDWATDYSGMVFMTNPPRRAQICVICGRTSSISVEDAPLANVEQEANDE